MHFAANEDLAYCCRRHEQQAGSRNGGTGGGCFAPGSKVRLRKLASRSPKQGTRQRAALLFASDPPRRAERCRGARSDGFCAGNDFPTHFFVGIPVAAREGESARRRSSGYDKRGAETWRIPAFAECRWQASGKVENGKKKEKRLVNVNIVLKVCFGVGKMGVEKTVCFLCTMHREEARKMAELTYPVGIKKRSDWVNYIYVIGVAWS